MTMDVNKDRFQARLARISAGQQFEAEGVIATKRTQKALEAARARKSPDRLGRGELLRVPLAFLGGMVSVLLARLFYFHDVPALLGMLPEQIPAALDRMGAMGLGAAMSAMLLMFFGLTRGKRPHALIAGFLLMFYAEPLVIAQAPGVFAQLLPAAYIEQATAHTS